MSYYQSNRQEILQKAKDRYCKEKSKEKDISNLSSIKMKYYSPNRFSLTKYKNISKNLLKLKLKNRTSIIVSNQLI